MSIKKVFTLPIVFSISAVLVTLIAESNLHRHLINNETLSFYFKSSDTKTLTFMIPLLMILATFVSLETIIFVLNKHKCPIRRRCKAVKGRMLQIYSLIFMTLITSYVAKVNETDLFKMSLTAMILSVFYMIGLFLRSSVVHFIFLVGVFYSLALLFCFSFVKYFAFSYQMFFIFVKKMFQ